MITEVKIFDAKAYTNSLIEKAEIKRNTEMLVLRQNNDAIQEAYKAIYENHLNRMEHWEAGTCEQCGAELREVTGYGFCGCPNFRDGKKHTTRDIGFNDEPFEMKPNMWLHELRAISKVKNISISAILKYLDKDIRHMITGEYTEINDFSEVKKRADEQEKKFKDATEKYFTSYKEQVGIIIKSSEHPRGKRRIPDVIASTNDDVFYIEIKNAFKDFNGDQFHETLNGIDWMMKQNNDQRKLYGCFYYFKNPLFDLSSDIVTNLKETAIS